jgi:DNA-binding transcriptional ArsR family regulator
MDNAGKLQLIFQVLSDVNRIQIIRFISDQQYSVSKIVEALNLSQPLISHHLRILRENQILVAERKGPFVYYRLKEPRLLSTLEQLIKIFSDECDSINSGVCSSRLKQEK